MIRLTLEYQGFEAIEADLHDIAYGMLDLRPLAEPIAGIMRDQNQAMRTVGHDQYDVPMVELAASTMKKRIRQGRLGPPLAPDGPASPIVTDFTVTSHVLGPGEVLLVGEWPGTPWVRFHTDNRDARYHLPVRDPAGLPAFAQAQVAEQFELFLSSLIRF